MVEAKRNVLGIIQSESQKKSPTSSQDNEESTLDILREFGLIGCISAEPDLSTNYKSVLREELDCKYDHR